MANKYLCSDGTKVTEATIKANLSKTYRRMYEGEPHPSCMGCGKRSEGSAHLVPRSVCKSHNITEYCWTEINIVPCCSSCNSILESYKSEEVKKLHCYDLLLEVTKQILPERYLKMIA